MSDDRILRIQRTFNGPVDHVFDAWVNPDILVQWWGPEGFSIPEHDIDPREGGAWTTTMLSPEGSRHVVSGIYKKIDRPNELVLTWSWKQDDGSQGHETEITVKFASEGDGTRMDFVQQVFAEAEHAANHRHGWDSSFNCLDKVFA